MLKQLLAVREYPSLLGKEEFSFSAKLGNVLKVYGILLLVLIFVYGPIHHIADHLVQNVLHYKNLNTQYQTDMDKFRNKVGHTPSIIYICLLGPIIEETVFRLPLSFKKLHIAFSLAFAVLLFSGLLHISKEISHSLGIWPTFAIRAGLSGTVFLIALKLLPNGIKLKDSLKLAIIVLSICIFGLMHIGNYVPIQWAIIWVYPIYVLPQLLIGWSLTFTRFKYGFVWGIALHCLVNSVSTSLYFAYQNQMPVQKTKSIPASTKPKVVDSVKIK